MLYLTSFGLKCIKKINFYLYDSYLFGFFFVGSALTRYLGYEAIMTIPEGSMENRIYSVDEYIQVKLMM